MFHLPVAERYDDVWEFQPFRLVYADDSDTLYLRTLYGLLADTFFPFLEKSRYVARLFTHEGAHLVIESAELGTLSFALREGLAEMKQIEQVFAQFIEWHAQQFLPAVTHFGRQQSVDVVLMKHLVRVYLG